MKTLCQPIDGLCSQCGEAVRERELRTCASGPNSHTTRRQPPCPHLGEATGEVALIKCQSCCGNVRKKFDVHQCALFGECLPRLANSTDTAGKERRGCRGCKRLPD